MSQHKKRTFKVLLLGDSNVGKTSLTQRYVNNTFSHNYKATIGVDFCTKELLLNGLQITIQIWDTAGLERFNTLGSAFYRGGDACILVFDVTDSVSFHHLQSWYNEFLIHAAPRDPDAFPFVALGNKVDLINRCVSPAQASQWCKQQNNMPYYEASAKDGNGVDDAFKTIVTHCLVMEKQQEQHQCIYDFNDGTVDLEKKAKKLEKCACN